MAQGWDLYEQYAIPSVFGFEQEIPIYQLAKGVQGQPSPMIQLEDTSRRRALSNFLVDYIVSQYSNSGYINCPISYSNFFCVDGRIYVDERKNLEICTMESSNPFETAQMLWSMRNKLTQCMLSRSDLKAYCDTGSVDSTVAFHENYFTQLSMKEIEMNLADDIVPALATRSVLTGTGGPSKTRDFVLSPRLSWIQRTSSDGSRCNRGFVLLRDVPHSSFGSRLQLLSSDQIFSYDNIALQCGITALAIRLGELGELPVTKVDWSRRYDELNKIGFSSIATNQLFADAVQYQRELFFHSKRYIDKCRRDGYYEIFGSNATTDELIDLWDKRLCDLELVCENGDISTIATSAEWAMKRQILETYRERHNIPSEHPLSSKEQWICSEMNSFVPYNESYKRLQENLFSKSNDTNDIYSTSMPRTQIRRNYVKDIAELLPYIKRGSPRVDWSTIGLYRTDKQLHLTLPTPFSGRQEDYLLLREAIITGKTTTHKLVAGSALSIGR